ncbi:DUF1577 domain-containing protein [Leptospira wolffii]|uniref:DUF1577 domain-containing protein n=1 Tax=Leptospira wolffii TaxID=409998 RepID=UPI0002E7EFE3|nr:DUF1577 domain-containing protein [Leptospira wolffii]
MSKQGSLDRDYDILTDASMISKIIESFLVTEEMNMKGFRPGSKGTIMSAFGDTGTISFRFESDTIIKPGETIYLQKTLKRQVELCCQVLRQSGRHEYLFQVSEIRIAKINRREERIRIQNDLAFATNVVFRPKTFQMNPQTLRTVIREVSEKFRTELGHSKFGEIQINLFEPGLDKKFNIVQQTKKIFYIPKAEQEESYRESSPQFLNYTTYFGKNILSAIRWYKNESIVSELILPILYNKNDKDSHPKAFIWILSKREFILPEDLSELNVFAEKIVSAIQNSDSIKATSRFEIEDISEFGVRLKIDQKQIIQSIYSNETLQFDVVFKGKPPIPIQGKIRWRSLDHKGKLSAGLEYLQDQNQTPNLRKIEYNIQSLRTKSQQAAQVPSSFFKIYRSLGSKKRKRKAK